MRRLLGFALLSLAACARPFPPPGGDPDTSPPGLVSIEPSALSVVAPGNSPVTFRFDERLSERGFSEALVLVSPQDGAVRIDRARSAVHVRIDGGWRPGRIYRVVLLPGLRDLFGNERREQAEVIFSTGPAIDNTALAGLVLDRITGAPAASGVVIARHIGSDARYVAQSDSTGFYSLRYVPLGDYDVSAYDDQNRNRRRDLLEPTDSGYSVTLAQAADTVAQIFHVLIPDTTAPRLEEARPIDSLHVRLRFDDYTERTSVEEVSATVHVLPDSVRVAGSIETLPVDVFEMRQRADTADAPAAPLPSLPVRELVIRLDTPLRPGTYDVTAFSFRNLHGLTGGGTARLELRAPEPPPPDTAGAVQPRDTAAVRTVRR